MGRCCCDRRSFRCTIVVLSASPSFQFGYLVRATKHPAGMSTSPGATDGSQRNSCKYRLSSSSSSFGIGSGDVCVFQ